MRQERSLKAGLQQLDCGNRHRGGKMGIERVTKTLLILIVHTETEVDNPIVSDFQRIQILEH